VLTGLSKNDQKTIRKLYGKSKHGTVSQKKLLGGIDEQLANPFISSAWYIQVCFDEWVAQDLASMSQEEMLKVLAARVLYVIPKLLLIGSVFILLTQRVGLVRSIAVAWIVAGLHTLTYYGAFEISLASSIEKVRLLVHHLIPHAYFAVVILICIYKPLLGDEDYYELNSKRT
jgi:hypothetical protein